MQSMLLFRIIVVLTIVYLCGLAMSVLRSLQHSELPDRAAVVTLDEFRAASSSKKVILVAPAHSAANMSLKQVEPHPRTNQGALDADGNPGYIHDTQYVRNHPLPFNHHPDHPELSEGICDLPPGKGIEGPAGIYALQKITTTANIPTKTTAALPKVLCIIYTHSNAHTKAALAVAETYGQRCDGFMAASNKTNITIGAVNILHEGPEAYGNMGQKVRSIWKYTYDNYLEDYDWFHIGGDNMFVIAENLKFAAYQETERQQKNDAAIYMGGAMQFVSPKKKVFICGGGAGYTLNRQALTRMVRDEFQKPHCSPNAETSAEDVMIASCLQKNIANCTNSFDDYEETRYHPFDAQYHASWKQWKPSNWHWRSLLKYYHINLSKELLESISATTASFHMTGHKAITTQFSDMGIRRYHAILYGKCPDHVYLPLNKSLNLAELSLDH